MVIQGTAFGWLYTASSSCSVALLCLGVRGGLGWDLLSTLLELGRHLYPLNREGLPKVTVTTSCLQLQEKDPAGVQNVNEATV